MDKLEEILQAQKEALEAQKAEFERAKIFRETTSADMEKQGKRIDALEAGVKGLEESLSKRASGVMPGLDDELEKEEVNIYEMLFESNSRSRSIMAEYTAKKSEAIGRDATASSDSNMGFLVPAQRLPGFIEKARARSVVWQEAGITILDNVVGEPVEIPIETGDPTLYDVGETAAPTASDVTVGLLSFRPRTLAALVKPSQRLFRQSPQLANQVIINAITKQYGITVDQRILRGSGASNQPLGIANTPNILNVEIGTNGGAFTLAVAENMQIAVEEENTSVPSMKYVGHPRAFHSMKAERILQYSGDTAGAYVMPSLSDKNVIDWLGYPFLKTTAIPKTLTKGSGTGLTEVYYGNWEDSWLALWEDILFKRSTEAGDAGGSAFTNRQVWIMAEMEYDHQLARPTSFCLVNDATTS